MRVCVCVCVCLCESGCVGVRVRERGCVRVESALLPQNLGQFQSWSNFYFLTAKEINYNLF